MTKTLMTGLIVSAGLTLAAGSASAAAFTVDWAGSGWPGTAKWDTFETRPNLSGGIVAAGAFELTGTLTDSSTFNFIAFCMDIETAIVKGKGYTQTSSPYSNGGLNLTVAQKTNIQTLFDLADPFTKDFTTDETFSSGFHLALLEIVYETTGNLYTLATESLTQGFFAAPTDLGDAGEVAAVAYGESLLGALNVGTVPSYPGLYSVQYFESDNNESQNLISATRTVAPIPVPAAGFLMFAGIGSLAVASRRRRRKA